MATVIVNSSVWTRVYEYYDNVESTYPNTWDINDTINQINKIQWVITNFEQVCVWSRDPIIPYWKRMGWKETWNRICPWHFAFESKNVDGNDYIYIQDAEHQDVVKECKQRNAIQQRFSQIITETINTFIRRECI